MDDYELFDTTNGRWWAGQQRELDSLIAQALAEPRIAKVLDSLSIPAEEVARAVRNREDVITRFRAARRWSARLGLTDNVPDKRFPRLRPGRGLILGLAVATAYLALLFPALPRMPQNAQAFSLLGLVAALLLAARLVRKDIAIVRRAVRSMRDPGHMPRVVQDAILPELRQYIAEHTEPRYGTTVSADQANLDSDVFESATIVTAAGKQLRRIVQRADADAIALAGPRGVGKTTTIRAISDGMFSDVNEPPPLSVVAAAPSRYDARDFVLHLHAVLCRRIIALTSARLLLSPEDDRPRNTAWRHVRAALLFAGVSVVLVVAATMFWLFSQEDGEVKKAPPRGEPLISSTGWTADTAKILVVLAAISLALALAILLGKLVTSFLWGIVNLAVRVVLGVWAGRMPDLVELRDEAYAQLRRIRFLQTYTSGWSGKIGLPSGNDVGVSRSLQRAEQTLTHPEVVDNFRRFAQLCASRLIETGMAGRLVIAIDELDKIAEPEQAHEFVNDIKGVFGVRNCLFLVSVSEDAMAAFERRGIPVRDAFDSAFTQMVRLDTFTLAESRRWLSRRLIGVPEQFTYLLHCLTGGLPREMRRATIELVDIVHEEGGSDLAHVAGTLLDRELDRKAHAFAAAARRYDDAPELSTYLTDLLTMTEAAADQVALATRLVSDGLPSDLHRVRWQSACFVLFCATLREVFVNTLKEDGLAGVEQLAEVRVHLAVDPQVAWRLLESVRAERSPVVSE